MTNKERSAAIRAEIKKLGYNSRQVSVRSRICGYSDETRIEVKDLSCDIKAIEKACMKFESIDYDQYSGEILSGGNTYIFVNYDWKALRDGREAKMAEAEAIFAKLDNEQVHIQKDEREFIIYKQGDFYTMACFENGLCAGTMEIRPTSNVNHFKASLATALATNFNTCAA